MVRSIYRKIYYFFSTNQKKKKKKDGNSKIATYKLKLLIVLDLIQLYFQVLLITCLKLTKKNAKHAWMEKILNQDVILLDLKIIIYITNAKNAEKYGWNHHYQVLLIAYLKLTKTNAKHALKKRSNQNADLLDLKIINLIRNAKNVKNMV